MHSTDRVSRRLTSECAAQPNGCLLWTGGRDGHGYGALWVSGKARKAHRVAYEAAYGEIPPGYVVDHVCHNDDPSCPSGRLCQHRRCINPGHLELVTPQENTRRGSARQTHCRRGHGFTEANTYYNAGRRCCRSCGRDNTARYIARKKAALA